MKNLFSFFRIFLAKINITSCAPACLPTSCVVPVLLKKLMTHSMNTNYLPFLNLIATYEKFEQKITNSSAPVFSGTRFQTSLPCNKKYFLLPASMYIHLSLYMPIYFRSISLHTCLPSLSLYLCLFYLSRSVCLSIFYIYGSICHSQLDTWLFKHLQIQ